MTQPTAAERVLESCKLALPPSYMRTEYHDGKESMHEELFPIIQALLSLAQRQNEALKDAQGYLCLEKCNHHPSNVWHSPACAKRKVVLADYDKTILELGEG